MLGEHDHHGVDPREMFALAALALPRPAAANDCARPPANRAKLVAAMPAEKAERGCENRRIIRIEQSEEGECGARIWYGLRSQRGETRRSLIKAQE